MEEYRVYLLQYTKGEEKINRFYATSRQHKEKLFELIEIFVQKKKHESLENIANIVETQFLENHFIALKGIKRILGSYKKIINNSRIYCVKID